MSLVAFALTAVVLAGADGGTESLDRAELCPTAEAFAPDAGWSVDVGGPGDKFLCRVKSTAGDRILIVPVQVSSEISGFEFRRGSKKTQAPPDTAELTNTRVSKVLLTPSGASGWSVAPVSLDPNKPLSLGETSVGYFGCVRHAALSCMSAQGRPCVACVSTTVERLLAKDLSWNSQQDLRACSSCVQRALTCTSASLAQGCEEDPEERGGASGGEDGGTR